MSAVPAPADRRFRRAHVKPTRKRRSWRAIVKPFLHYGILGSLLLYCAYRGLGVVAHAHVLQVNRILVRGNERLSKGEVLAVLNGLRGENLIWTDLDGWRRRLLATAWVRDAALKRRLPSTVEVEVLERQPIGIGRIHGDMYLVDDHGIVIDQYGPQYADFDLAIIDGLSGSRHDGGSPDDEPRANLAARLLATVKAKPEIAQRVSQIDVSDPHNAAVILSGDSAVVQLGEDQFLERLQTYIDLAQTLHHRVRDIDSVDLRFNDRIYVRPASKRARSGYSLNDAARASSGGEVPAAGDRSHPSLKKRTKSGA